MIPKSNKIEIDINETREHVLAVIDGMSYEEMRALLPKDVKKLRETYKVMVRGMSNEEVLAFIFCSRLLGGVR